jgi:hypothetical protein
MEETPTKPKKSKSETRKKGKIIGVRVDPVELAEIQAKAESAGLTVASFIRINTLENVITETRTAPSLDRILLSQLLGQLGKIGSNINQIARRMNEGGSVGADRVTAACDEFSVLRDELIKAIRGLDDNQGKIKRAGGTGGAVSS